MATVDRPLGLGAKTWGIGSILAVLFGILGIVLGSGMASIVGTASVVLVVFGVVCLLLAVGTFLGDSATEEPA